MKWRMSQNPYLLRADQRRAPAGRSEAYLGSRMAELAPGVPVTSNGTLPEVDPEAVTLALEMNHAGKSIPAIAAALDAFGKPPPGSLAGGKWHWAEVQALLDRAGSGPGAEYVGSEQVYRRQW